MVVGPATGAQDKGFFHRDSRFFFFSFFSSPAEVRYFCTDLKGPCPHARERWIFPRSQLTGTGTDLVDAISG